MRTRNSPWLKPKLVFGSSTPTESMDEVKLLNNFKALIKITKNALESTSYFIAGCSARAKSEYSNALQVIGDQINEIRTCQSTLEGTMLDSLTKHFCSKFENLLLEVLSLGKIFLKREVSYSQFMMRTDEIKGTLEFAIENCNSDAMELMADGGMAVTDVRGSRGNVVEINSNSDMRYGRNVNYDNFVKLMQLIKVEKQKNATLEDELEALRLTYSKKREETKIEEEALEEKKVLMLNYRNAFEKIIATENNTKLKLSQYQDRVKILAVKLKTLRNMADENPENQEYVNDIKAEISMLEAENNELKSKIEELEKELSEAISQAQRLVANVTADVRHGKSDSEVTTLRRDLGILYNQVDNFTKQLRELTETERMFEEMSHSMDLRLKNVLKDIRKKKSQTPEELMKVFQSLVDETELIWHTLGEICS